MFLRVAADIPKIEKSYWYKSDESVKGHSEIRVGSIVRINLHGRRVRGWVCESAQDHKIIDDKTGQDFDPEKLKNIVEFVSDGVPPHLVDFCEKLGRQYLCSPITFLRMCSPPKIIRGLGFKKYHFGEGSSKQKFIVDPRADRREQIQDNIAKSGTTIIVSPDSHSRLTKWLNEIGLQAINYSEETSQLEVFKNSTKQNVVIVGGRSALFAPSSDCQSIIVLDDSYEQLRDERSPKWSAIDVAGLASESWKIPVCAITSIPSASTFDFQTHDLREKNNYWPVIDVENMNQTDPVLGLFTPKVVSAINQSTKSGLDSAIVLNNTASARMLICRSCDAIATCENCDHAVYLDENVPDPLVCPVCFTSRPSICLKCKGSSFKKLRKGVQSLASECAGIFPKNKIIELWKNSKDIQSDDAGANRNIYVTTEVLFHRSDLCKKLGCVIFIDIDSVLFRPSMNAFEQTLVLINRGLRSISKSDLRNPIVVSTRAPDNVLIQDILKSDFYSNFSRELDLRKELRLAPFFATAKIKAKTEAVDKLVDSLDPDLVSAKIDEKEDSIVYLTAKNHDELTEKALKPVRNLASNNRCVFSVDYYD